MNKNILVLGGGGFIGGHLAKRLKSEGNWVRVADIKNEPSFLSYTAQKLADIKDVSKKEITKITTKNFNNLFFN